MAKRDFHSLLKAIEDERLKLSEERKETNAIHSSDHFRIVTPEFASLHDDDALIRAAAALGRLSPTEARIAARVLETEHRLRENTSRSITQRFGGWTLLVEIAALVAAIIAAVVGVLSVAHH